MSVETTNWITMQLTKTEALPTKDDQQTIEKPQLEVSADVIDALARKIAPMILEICRSNEVVKAVTEIEPVVISTHEQSTCFTGDLGELNTEQLRHSLKWRKEIPPPPEEGALEMLPYLRVLMHFAAVADADGENVGLNYAIGQMIVRNVRYFDLDFVFNIHQHAVESIDLLILNFSTRFLFHVCLNPMLYEIFASGPYKSNVDKTIKIKEVVKYIIPTVFAKIYKIARDKTKCTPKGPPFDETKTYYEQLSQAKENSTEMQQKMLKILSNFQLWHAVGSRVPDLSQ